MAPDLAANMRATTEALVMAFDRPWAEGAREAAVAPRAPECEHFMLPSSLGSAAKNNDEWAAYFKHVENRVLEAKMTIHDYLAVPSERRAVCRSSMVATTTVGPFKNEYVWFLTFNERGDKIVNITEFLDTKATADIRARFAEADAGGNH